MASVLFPLYTCPGLIKIIWRWSWLERGHCVQTFWRWGWVGGTTEKPHFWPSADSLFPFALKRNMDLLLPKAADGGGSELKEVERIYHNTKNVLAHRDVTVNMQNMVGVCFLRQITVIRLTCFPGWWKTNSIWRRKWPCRESETETHCLKILYVLVFNHISYFYLEIFGVGEATTPNVAQTRAYSSAGFILLLFHYCYAFSYKRLIVFVDASHSKNHKLCGPAEWMHSVQ